MKRISAIIIAMLFITATAIVGCSKTNGKKSSDDGIIYETLDLSKYVKVGQYLGVETEKTDEVAEDEIVVAIKDCLYENNYYTLGKAVTDRAVEEDDYLTVDIVGTIDDVAFKGGSQSDYIIVTGINAFATWSKYLIGAEVGQIAKVQFAVPGTEGYGDVAGKNIIYSIKIKKIQHISYSELTAEVIYDLSGYTTLDELVEYLKTAMEKDLKEDKMDDVWDTVMDNAKILDYPQKQLDKYIDSYYKLNEGNARQSTISFEKYLESKNQTEEDFQAEAEKYAKKCVAEELVCYYIAKEQKLLVSDEEYEEGLSKYYADNESKYSSEEEMEEKMGKDKITMNLLLSKVMNLVTNAAVTHEVETSSTTE